MQNIPDWVVMLSAGLILLVLLVISDRRRSRHR